MLQGEFQVRRDHPAIGISGESSSDSEARSHAGAQLGFAGEEQLVTLMAAVIKLCNGPKHRVIRDANGAIGSQSVIDLAAGLELPRVSPSAESAVQRGIHEQREPSEIFPDNPRDLVSPWTFGESRSRVSELLGNSRFERETPRRRSYRRQPRAISDIRDAYGVPRIRDCVETRFEPARKTGAQLDARAKRAMSHSAIGVVSDLYA